MSFSVKASVKASESGKPKNVKEKWKKQSPQEIFWHHYILRTLLLVGFLWDVWFLGFSPFHFKASELTTQNKWKKTKDHLIVLDVAWVDFSFMYGGIVLFFDQIWPFICDDAFQMRLRNGLRNSELIILNSYMDPSVRLDLYSLYVKLFVSSAVWAKHGTRKHWHMPRHICDVSSMSWPFFSMNSGWFFWQTSIGSIAIEAGKGKYCM